MVLLTFLTCGLLVVRLRQHVKDFAQQVLGKKSPEELERLEAEALGLESNLFGGLVPRSHAVLAMDLLSAFIPLSNLFIFAIGSEDSVHDKLTSIKWKGATSLCAWLHDPWLFASILVLFIFQVARAYVALWTHPYCVYGAWAPLIYLSTDLSAMGDTAPWR